MAKFTPGPWEVNTVVARAYTAEEMNGATAVLADASHKQSCAEGTAACVCMVAPSHNTTEEDAANARLIAAAPEMYAGLESAYQLLACLGESGDLSVIDTAAVLSEAIRIREILSKAVT